MEVCCELGARKKVVVLGEQDDVLRVCALSFGVDQHKYACEMYREKWGWVEFAAGVTLVDGQMLRLVPSATLTSPRADSDALPAENQQR